MSQALSSVSGQELLILGRPLSPGRGSDGGTQGAQPVWLTLFPPPRRNSSPLAPSSIPPLHSSSCGTKEVREGARDVDGSSGCGGAGDVVQGVLLGETEKDEDLGKNSTGELGSEGRHKGGK